jgi:hypothetical protein
VLRIGVVVLILSLSQWWRDVMREGDLGFHTSYVVKGLRDGFIPDIIGILYHYELSEYLVEYLGNDHLT